MSAQSTHMELEIFHEKKLKNNYAVEWCCSSSLVSDVDLSISLLAQLLKSPESIRGDWVETSKRFSLRYAALDSAKITLKSFFHETLAIKKQTAREKI